MTPITTLEDIQRHYADDLKSVNDRIGEQLRCPNALMQQVVTAHLRNKGKQLRPLVVVLCARMFGDVNDKVISSAAAVELLHNASLIHDDVVDESMLRRNNPTVNSLWGNHLAVLVGDFFTTGAMQQAISTSDIRIVDALCKLGKKLSIGEVDQIYNAREHALSIENYYNVIDYKTASLFVASAEMGCLSVGVDDRRMELMAEFTRLFGRCFQIRDDIFDYYDSAAVGKPTGNDLREGKVSLPLLYVLGRKDLPDHAAIVATAMKEQLDDDEIRTLQAYARDHGGIDYSLGVMSELRERAAGILSQLPECREREMLSVLFDFIIARDH